MKKSIYKKLSERIYAPEFDNYTKNPRDIARGFCGFGQFLQTATGAALLKNFLIKEDETLGVLG
jgi:hypothetical protein